MTEVEKHTNETVTKSASIKKTRNGVWIEKSYSASVPLFWIKGHVAVDYRAVHVDEQNTMLGVIPAGQNKQTIPLKTISGATISTAYKFSRFFWGVVLAFIGLAMISDSPLFGIILVAVGVVMFLNGIMTSLVIEKSGTAYVLTVPFFNKKDIVEVQNVIEQALSADADKVDESLYHKRLNDDEMSKIR